MLQLDPAVGSLISPAVDCATLVINVLSAFYVYRQRVTVYRGVRSSLLGVYLASIIIITLELAHTFFPNNAVMMAYAVGGVGLVVFIVGLLTLTAIGIYLSPTGEGRNNWALLKALLKHRIHASIFFGFVSYLVLTAAYLVAIEPFSIVYAPNLWGVEVRSVSFDSMSLGLLVGVLVLFMAYPTPLFVSAARRVTNSEVSRALWALPVCCIATGADLLTFDGYFWSLGIAANDVAYFIWAILFAVTALTFRKASTLASFFEVSPSYKLAEEEKRRRKKELGGGESDTHPFSTRLGAKIDSLEGSSILFEVDPSKKFEDVVQSFASEFLASENAVFVITSKGSPIYAALSKLEGVRFYLMSGSVSYPKPTTNPHEMLIPQNDQAIILDVIQKTSNVAESVAKVALIFDNLSDMILYSGFEICYKFLKQLNELVSNPRMTELFLLTREAHDEKYVNILRSLFSNHIVSDSQGLRLTKGNAVALATAPKKS